MRVVCLHGCGGKTDKYLLHLNGIHLQRLHSRNYMARHHMLRLQVYNNPIFGYTLSVSNQYHFQ